MGCNMVNEDALKKGIVELEDKEVEDLFISVYYIKKGIEGLKIYKYIDSLIDKYGKKVDLSKEEDEEIKKEETCKKFEEVMSNSECNAWRDFCSKYKNTNLKFASYGAKLSEMKEYLKFIGDTIYNYLEKEMKTRIRKIKDMKEDKIKSIEKMKDMKWEAGMKLLESIKDMKRGDEIKSLKRRKPMREIEDMKGEDGIKPLKRRKLIKEMK